METSWRVIQEYPEKHVEKPMLHQENDKTVKVPKNIFNYFYLAVVDLDKTYKSPTLFKSI